MIRTLPAALSAAIDVVTALFTGLFDLIVGLVFPTTPTPVSALAAFGLIFPLIGVAYSFLRRLTGGNGG